MPILNLQGRNGTRGHLNGSTSRQDSILGAAASPFVSMMRNTAQCARNFGPCAFGRVFQQPQLKAVIRTVISSCASPSTLAPTSALRQSGRGSCARQFYPGIWSVYIAIGCCKVDPHVGQRQEHSASAKDLKILDCGRRIKDHVIWCVASTSPSKKVGKKRGRKPKETIAWTMH